MKPSVKKIISAYLPTAYGNFQIVVFKSVKGNLEHVALVKGESFKKPPMVRVHSQCLTGDTFSSLRCDCREQLHQSMRLIGSSEAGIILYLNQEGRGLGLTNKIKAYSLQDQGYDTVEANHALGFPADARQYKIAADILKDLEIYKINLLTNNPDKAAQLTSHGITVKRCIPLEVTPNKINKSYLTTKKNKLGHKLNLV